MGKMKRTGFVLLAIAAIIVVALLTTRLGSSSTVMHALVSEKKPSGLSELEKTKQKSELRSGVELYAGVYFIESPKGTKYCVKWYKDDKMIAEETKQMQVDRKGMMVFTLKKDINTAGDYRVEICSKDSVVKTITFETR